MVIHTSEPTAQHLARGAIAAMAQATSSAYGESPIARDDRREPSGTTEDDPTPIQTYAKDQPAKPETENAELADLVAEAGKPAITA